MKKNVYTHSIQLEPLKILNTDRKEFAEKLVAIPYRGYEVEQLSDGRKIVITKPGGKSNYGKIAKEDFLVFIYDPAAQTLWQITHRQIYEDLVEKASVSNEETIKIIDALELVFQGTEPDTALQTINIKNPAGELPEALLKAYKWIWGQEDVNYPNGEGRAMSFNAIKELRDDLS
jgi:hypothetical protein